MAVPLITDLKLWVGTLFTKDYWDFNFRKIVGWFSDGNADLVVNSVKATNGIDLDGAQLSNVGPATSGDQAINLDQATTLLNRSSYYYPFSVASGKVDSNGDAAYLQKDSDTQVTVLAGNTSPDLICILSDSTIETVTSNTVLTVSTTDGTYNIVKEKGQSITITAGTVTQAKKFPTSPSIGDYYCDDSVVPFKGWKYTAEGWTNTEFCHLGVVIVDSLTATVQTFNYNDNNFDVNSQSLKLITPDYSKGIATTTSGVTSMTYTCPSDGFANYYITGASGQGNVYTVKVNNETVNTITSITSGGEYDLTGALLLSKGDVVELSSTQIIYYGLYFFPLKGEQ